MPPVQRKLAIRSIQIARQGMDLTVNSPAYREGMKYGKRISMVFSLEGVLTGSCKPSITLMRQQLLLRPSCCVWRDSCTLVLWTLPTFDH